MIGEDNGVGVKNVALAASILASATELLNDSVGKANLFNTQSG